MPLAVGDRLGPYRILAPVGAGGMGQVYRALDTQLKREVALKTLLPAFANDPERYARFRREAEVLAALNHPNIATLYGITSGALAMEFIEGETLPCPLPPGQALKVARQIAEALELCTREGRGSPRSQTIEHQGYSRRNCQTAGFRVGESARQHTFIQPAY